MQEKFEITIFALHPTEGFEECSTELRAKFEALAAELKPSFVRCGGFASWQWFCGKTHFAEGEPHAVLLYVDQETQEIFAVGIYAPEPLRADGVRWCAWLYLVHPKTLRSENLTRALLIHMDKYRRDWTDGHMPKGLVKLRWGWTWIAAPSYVNQN